LHTACLFLWKLIGLGFISCPRNGGIEETNCFRINLEYEEVREPNARNQKEEELVGT
jgi:hypothetical protein